MAGHRLTLRVKRHRQTRRNHGGVFESLSNRVVEPANQAADIAANSTLGAGQPTSRVIAARDSFVGFAD
jgi:hypothetical protein